MATVEFLQNRVTGKEKELAKLEKKMERILAAQASNWENNPYWYREEDIRYTTKDIEACKKALESYKVQLAQQVEKDNSRNVEAILTFLANWKQRMFAAHEDAVPKYLEARKAWYEYDRNNKAYDWRWAKEHTVEEVKAARKEYREAKESFYGAWKWLTPYLENDALNAGKLNKDLDNEANAKYDFIIERTNAIVGEITDASNLKVGAKGDLNGYIIGTKGTAKVQTIGAGGYNIQCFHFRTLINKQ